MKHFLTNGSPVASREMSRFGIILASVPSVILTVIVIVMVLGSLDTTTDDLDLGADGNDTRDDIFSNTWNAMAMTPIIPLILVSSIVLGAIGMLRLGGVV